MKWKALIDKALATNFDAPVYDPKKGRDKLVKLIDKAAEQHSTGSTPPTRSWKAGANGAIRFTPTLNGNPVLLDGEKSVYMPAERFQDFLAYLKSSVLAGDLDNEIKAALEGKSATGSTSAKPAATRNVSAQSALNIGVAAKRRAANPPSFDEIRKSYIDAGHDAAQVDAAIEKRKAAENA